MSTTRKLPTDFLWGYSTAAPQCEDGGEESVKESGRGRSVWDAFCEKPGTIVDGSHTYRTTNHYGRYKEDVALMKKLGVNSYRFSLSWARIIPLGGRNDPVNEKGLQFYDNLINELLANGITPFVTLFHWDLPENLFDKYGGWLNKEESSADFEHYARVCFERYSDRVKNWLTFNEIMTYCGQGYGWGVHAPGRKSRIEPFIVGHSSLIAHAKAVAVFRKDFQKKTGGQIGLSINGDWVIPYTDNDVAAVQKKLDATFGWFADPIFIGDGYPESLVKQIGPEFPSFTPEEQALLKGSADFFAMNSYTTFTVEDKAPEGELYHDGLTIRFTRADGSNLAGIWWLQGVPWGFKETLKYLWNRYKLPLYITENGFCPKSEDKKVLPEVLQDDGRVEYFKSYLNSMLEAIEEGVDVRSYYAWSFNDNFEWSTGFTSRFGCIYTDLKTLDRTPKQSAYFLQDWFAQHIAH